MTIEWKNSSKLVPYTQAIGFMEERVREIYEGKADECVWMVEHPPLYTAGTSAKQDDLIDKTRFPVYETGRGGEFTYHGPGQRVVYVMLNLKERKAMDIRKYVCNLEQWIINILAHFDIDGQRRQGRIGIWVEDGVSESKIAALGIRVRRWVTFHGIAINISPDLSHFGGIVPCGISEYGVTSMQKQGVTASFEEVDAVLKSEFEKIFGS
ncbi:lipoyl(octanoyl) transferase LipB [Rickettsiales bacterium]|nr:lipoyl(octanoyl) transferase LipB [Rickettsiales bacterium]